MVKKVFTYLILMSIIIYSCTTVKHEYYTISAIPVYDSLGNVYYHEETVDHFPTKEDSAAFIMKTGSRIYRVTKRDNYQPE